MKMKLTILGISAIALSACQMVDSSPARVVYPTTYNPPVQTHTPPTRRIMKPVEHCFTVQVPVYGTINRPASSVEILGGVVAGGVIGNQFGGGSGKTALTALGAIAGGNIGAGRKTEQAIVGYNPARRCKTIYE